MPESVCLLTLMQRKYALLALVAGGVLIGDQVTKTLVLHWMPLYHTIPVINGFFDLVHVHNPGGAFGFLSGQHPMLRSVLFLSATAVAIGLILTFYHRTPAGHHWLATAFSLILGGALGNLVDRLRFGQVVDFLDVYIGRYHWPAFNVADSAITVGIAIFLVLLLRRKLPE